MELIIGIIIGGSIASIAVGIWDSQRPVDINEKIRLMEAMHRDLPLKERAEKVSE
jgi:hypothetical protein